MCACVNDFMPFNDLYVWPECVKDFVFQLFVRVHVLHITCPSMINFVCMDVLKTMS